MRTNHSMKNMIIGMLSQLIIAGLGFISRKVFIDSLGADYLGINGLLTNVLSMLALIESGIGTSITYSLYKPLVNDDRRKIIALVQLYKKAYLIIAFIVCILSLALLPFLGVFIKGGGTESFIIISYLIFVGKNMTYYLNAHKVALITADQKSYVLARVNIGFQIVTMLAKIAILILTHNYILFLLIELMTFILQNMYNGRIVTRRYPFIKTSPTQSIASSEKQYLKKNIKALFLHNVGSYAVFGTDNLLISAFIGVTTVGFYSNYTMILGQLSTLIAPLLNGIGASVGHLIAKENETRRYFIFKVSYFMNFWIYSVVIVCLFNLLEPFINWWLGKGFLLSPFTFWLILVNFYLTGLRTSISTFKTKAGIFIQDKYMPLIEAFINLVASLILVHFIGLSGIFLGTTISTLATVFWNVPRLTYKHVFKRSVGSYFAQYALYAGLTLTMCVLTMSIGKILVSGVTLLALIERGLICVVLSNLLYILLFYKTTEFQYLLQLVSHLISNMKTKWGERERAKA
ncbi:sugar translocase [Pullulanibacillus camelliae]|uniref:Sugar translocase n=1 Tax=Pullulanibacillus camelliae TaxID=1707096 RepID=A0A8J2VGX5_9BACL|nr:hypothetical protein [Pullulanibacillus camelliae]GGE30553.1 sugar translocase [Pullulanibacillus camelliae]